MVTFPSYQLSSNTACLHLLIRCHQSFNNLPRERGPKQSKITAKPLRKSEEKIGVKFHGTFSLMDLDIFKCLLLASNLVLPNLYFPCLLSPSLFSIFLELKKAKMKQNFRQLYMLDQILVTWQSFDNIFKSSTELI